MFIDKGWVIECAKSGEIARIHRRYPKLNVEEFMLKNRYLPYGKGYSRSGGADNPDLSPLPNGYFALPGYHHNRRAMDLDGNPI